MPASRDQILRRVVRLTRRGIELQPAIRQALKEFQMTSIPRRSTPPSETPSKTATPRLVPLSAASPPKEAWCSRHGEWVDRHLCEDEPVYKPLVLLPSSRTPKS